MRSIAEDKLDVTEEFGKELYYCLGCLACETACPAGVSYATMFEEGRADIEAARVLANPQRDIVRTVTLRWMFTQPLVLRAVGRLLRWYQVSGVENFVRDSGVLRLLPKKLRDLESLTPRVQPDFSDALIREVERPQNGRRYRVGVLTGCVQDLVLPHVNRDTVDVLLANGCEVITPRMQHCCGSLHAHNGELELSREMARRNIEDMERAAGPIEQLDAIITNAAGCGSHLKNYDRLLEQDSKYAGRAKAWSAKLKDIHEWLIRIDAVAPATEMPMEVTYHEACHLCHGQKITRQPRQILQLIPGLKLIELPESTWCCGSAGIYNITQPEQSAKLLARKMKNIALTQAPIVASANPGCTVQLEAGVRNDAGDIEIVHPVSLLARAYRAAEMRQP
jgi:glycolate oxidase iron-sulfur subunit